MKYKKVFSSNYFYFNNSWFLMDLNTRQHFEATEQAIERPFTTVFLAHLDEHYRKLNCYIHILKLICYLFVHSA